MRTRLSLIGGVWFTVLVAILAGAQATAPGNTIVITTKTGTKYHRPDCTTLRATRTEMPLAVASQRYQPCQVCLPPTLALTSPKPQPKGLLDMKAPASTGTVSRRWLVEEGPGGWRVGEFDATAGKATRWLGGPSFKTQQDALKMLADAMGVER